ncbi:hypothetical protein J5J86_20785 [Aquabacter sp. L1I39]|uniref:hypothetical protein n=1 Tax=Aquabacter sp. L1I39 TaxID=2820278 RepID=UPI001ADC3EC2|nr:hypothetical protein [Aquabacter sp. L1I39]QTL03162.1 hypothetical protein J5J86_20785 [Aquabacter sp. L1I39]
MSDLLITGRRNFLVRALGFVALPAAAAVPSSSRLPTISQDLIVKMEAWRGAYRDFQHLNAMLDERRPDGMPVHSTMSRPGVLNEFGERYHDRREHEHEVRMSMLREILKVT